MPTLEVQRPGTALADVIMAVSRQRCIAVTALRTYKPELESNCRRVDLFSKPSKRLGINLRAFASTRLLEHGNDVDPKFSRQ
jgi:hypothetical protein